MQYFKPFKYFFLKKPGGWRNVGIGCLCGLVPYVGQIVWLGYRAEVNDDLEHDPSLERYSDFSTDRLMPYLTRGLWPWLTSLIVSIAIIGPAYILSIIVGIGIGTATGNIYLALGVYAAIFLTSITALDFVLWPMELHAMKTRKLQLNAELRFAWGFLRTVGLETAVTIFIFNMMSQILMLCGLLLLVVGVFPALVLKMMAEQHLMLQLYQRYIEEGGKPIDTWSEFDRELDAAPRPKARRAEPEIE
jgi:hypothetical protein